jgi:hypothetical protein
MIKSESLALLIVKWLLLYYRKLKSLTHYAFFFARYKNSSAMRAKKLEIMGRFFI